MAFIGRLVRLTLFAFFGVTAVSAVVAFQRKQNAPPPPDADADEIELVAIFDELDFRSESQAFRGGRVECWFAGGTIDLRAATLHPDGAVLHTQAVFGGGSVIVPPDWVVTTNVVGIGGAGDARGVEAMQDGPRLTIDGMAVFGGWGILTSDPRVEAPATI